MNLINVDDEVHLELFEQLLTCDLFLYFISQNQIEKQQKNENESN